MNRLWYARGEAQIQSAIEAIEADLEWTLIEHFKNSTTRSFWTRNINFSTS